MSGGEARGDSGEADGVEFGVSVEAGWTEEETEEGAETGSDGNGGSDVVEEVGREEGMSGCEHYSMLLSEVGGDDRGGRL